MKTMSTKEKIKGWLFLIFVLFPASLALLFAILWPLWLGIASLKYLFS